MVFSLDRARTTAFGHGRAATPPSRKLPQSDDYTVHVKLAGPAPLYVQNLTNTFIMSKEWAEENDTVTAPNFAAGEESYSVRNANGTGPTGSFRATPEVRTVLEAFEGHWDEAPEVTEIIYTPDFGSSDPRRRLGCRARSTSFRTFRCRTSHASKAPTASASCVARKNRNILLLLRT